MTADRPTSDERQALEFFIRSVVLSHEYSTIGGLRSATGWGYTEAAAVVDRLVAKGFVTRAPYSAQRIGRVLRNVEGQRVHLEFRPTLPGTGSS